jgi:hypothetical protein
MLRALVDSLAGFAVPTNHEVQEGRGPEADFAPQALEVESWPFQLLIFDFWPLPAQSLLLMSTSNPISIQLSTQLTAHASQHDSIPCSLNGRIVVADS